MCNEKGVFINYSSIFILQQKKENKKIKGGKLLWHLH